MRLSEKIEEMVKERVFENKEMKDLNIRIMGLETEFKKKYSLEILKDYSEIAELMLEEFILGSELYFEFGFEFIKECLLSKIEK